MVLHQPLHPRYADPAASHWHVQPAISGGGLFMDLGCHTLNLLDWLFGPIVAACGQASNQRGAYAAEDSVAMSFAFGSGLVGTGLWQFGSFRHHDSIEVIGERGRLAFATFGDGPITLETAAGERDASISTIPLHIQQPLIETIVAELRGQAGACPSTAGRGCPHGLGDGPGAAPGHPPAPDRPGHRASRAGSLQVRPGSSGSKAMSRGSCWITTRAWRSRGDGLEAMHRRPAWPPGRC